MNPGHRSIGIYLENCTNVDIDSCEFRGDLDAIVAKDSRNIRARNIIVQAERERSVLSSRSSRATPEPVRMDRAISRSRIALVIGNGLSLSIRGSIGQSLEGWHPSAPLSWNVPNPTNPTTQLLDALPRLKRALQVLRAQCESLSDFDLLEAIRRRDFSGSCLSDEDHLYLLTEARHFLCLAYSQFQKRVDIAGIGRSAWSNWITKYMNSITFCVSYNYDLSLERLLASAGQKYFGFGVLEPKAGVPLLKPHGSIDLDSDTRAISLPPVRYPLENWASMNDCALRRLSSEMLPCGRVDVNVVLPGEASFARGFQSVDPGYKRFRSLASTWSGCVIVGLSYWACDREEIDFLLDSFAPGAHVYVVDPSPSPALRARIESRGLQFHESSDPPDLILQRE